MARRGRLILIVDPDLDFVEDTRLLLDGERLLAARSLEEAEEIAVGGRVDAAVLGPSFGNEAGVRAAGALLAVDPGIHLVLAANVVTNRVLLAVLQTGFADVVDTPLTVRKLGSSLTPRSRADTPARLLDVLVELAPAEAVTARGASWPVTAAVEAPPRGPGGHDPPSGPGGHDRSSDPGDHDRSSGPAAGGGGSVRPDLFAGRRGPASPLLRPLSWQPLRTPQPQRRISRPSPRPRCHRRRLPRRDPTSRGCGPWGRAGSSWSWRARAGPASR